MLSRLDCVSAKTPKKKTVGWGHGILRTTLRSSWRLLLVVGKLRVLALKLGSYSCVCRGLGEIIAIDSSSMLLQPRTAAIKQVKTHMVLTF